MDETQRLAHFDHAHVWHPFTPMRQWREHEPLIVDRADGFELIDTHGNRYIDGFSSLWCNVHGHRVPEIDRAITDQLSRVAHSTLLGFSNAPSIELAARLVETVNTPTEGAEPPLVGARLERVFFSDAGATATEVAFKMVVGHHYHSGHPERDTLIGFSGAYHGDTIGAMSVGYVDAFHRPYRKLTFRTVWAPAPDVCRTDAPTNDPREWPSWDQERRVRVCDHALKEFERVLDEVGEHAAGVVIEPLMQGAGGMIEQPEGFLAGVARAARSRNIPLIADAVAVGFGRTGAMFACELEGVRPDVLCLAKGITGGYLPLAATLCTNDIAASFEGEHHERRTLYHGHTYTGNQLGCAAALASLDLFKKNDILSNVGVLQQRLRSRLRAELADLPTVGDVRIRGVMAGIELVASRSPWRSLDPEHRLAVQVCELARQRGLMIRPLGNVVILMPAPAMPLETLDRMLDILIAVIRTCGTDAKVSTVHPRSMEAPLS